VAQTEIESFVATSARGNIKRGRKMPRYVYTAQFIASNLEEAKDMANHLDDILNETLYSADLEEDKE
jgi:hypothetical protein